MGENPDSPARESLAVARLRLNRKAIKRYFKLFSPYNDIIIFDCVNPRMHRWGLKRPQGLLFFNIFKIKCFYISIFQVFLIKHVCDMRPFNFL